MNEPTATFEDRYRQLGYLFYSVASCDQSIIQSEIDALERMVREHWRNEDPGYDELGIESVKYIELHFDHALEQRWSEKKAYALFAEAQLREPQRFSGWTKSLIMRTAMAIARASGSINRSEAARLSELQELLGRSV